MKKTSKLFVALTIMACTFLTITVKAQSTDDGKFRFGIGVDGLLPIGNLSNSENFALGITPRLQYSVNDRFALTFTSGYYHFFPKKLTLLGSESYYSFKYHLDLIPVKAGLKVFLADHIYLAGEAGAGFEVEDGGGPVKLILSPAVGYAQKHWDVGVRYENFSGQNNAYGVIGLRVAYGFGL